MKNAAVCARATRRAAAAAARASHMLSDLELSSRRYWIRFDAAATFAMDSSVEILDSDLDKRFRL